MRLRINSSRVLKILAVFERQIEEHEDDLISGDELDEYFQGRRLVRYKYLGGKGNAAVHLLNRLGPEEILETHIRWRASQNRFKDATVLAKPTAREAVQDAVTSSLRDCLSRATATSSSR